jgi:hypothetical protein
VLTKPKASSNLMFLSMIGEIFLVFMRALA